MMHLKCSSQRKWNGGYQGLEGERNGELLFNGYRVSVWEDENMLGRSSANGCPTVRICLMP